MAVSARKAKGAGAVLEKSSPKDAPVSTAASLKTFREVQVRSFVLPWDEYWVSVWYSHAAPLTGGSGHINKVRIDSTGVCTPAQECLPIQDWVTLVGIGVKVVYTITTLPLPQTKQN